MRCIYRRCGFPYKFSDGYTVDNGYLRFTPIYVDKDNWEIDSMQAYVKENLKTNDFFAGLYNSKFEKVAEFQKKSEQIVQGTNNIPKVEKETIFSKKGCNFNFYIFLFIKLIFDKYSNYLLKYTFWEFMEVFQYCIRILFFVLLLFFVYLNCIYYFLFV